VSCVFIAEIDRFPGNSWFLHVMGIVVVAAGGQQWPQSIVALFPDTPPSARVVESVLSCSNRLFLDAECSAPLD
jgi:hypothetical protein